MTEEKNNQKQQKTNPASHPHSNQGQQEFRENARCPCAFKFCERHGNCEECQAYHHARSEKTSCGK